MLRIKQYQVAFYDNEICYDETFFPPDEADIVDFYIEQLVNKNERYKAKIYIHLEDGRIYELKLEQVCKSHVEKNEL